MSDFAEISSGSQLVHINPTKLQLDQPLIFTSKMSPENPLPPLSMEWTQDHSPQPACNPIDCPMPDSPQSEFSSPLILPFDIPTEERAQSQPPDFFFHRSANQPRYRNPRSSAHNRHLRGLSDRLPRGTTKHNNIPRRHTPTSVPLSEPQPISQEDRELLTVIPQYGEESSVLPVPQDVIFHLSDSALSTDDVFLLPYRQSQHTSVSIYLESRLTQLQQSISSLQQYLMQSYILPDNDKARQEVEQSRLSCRIYNRNLTELSDTLIALPRHSGAFRADLAIPETGLEIRTLDHTTIDALLDSYDIPFSPTMFLWEKKALYLRFVGAGRALMHRVLD